MDRQPDLTADERFELSTHSAESEIAEHEIFFALNDAGSIGMGFTPDEAKDCLMDADDSGVAVRSFSIRVRARKPHVELGPEIDIADKDVEVASVAQADPR